MSEMSRSTAYWQKRITYVPSRNWIALNESRKLMLVILEKGKGPCLLFCWRVEQSNRSNIVSSKQQRLLRRREEEEEELTGLDLEAKIWAEMSRRPRGSEAWNNHPNQEILGAHKLLNVTYNVEGLVECWTGQHEMNYICIHHLSYFKGVKSESFSSKSG